MDSLSDLRQLRIAVLHGGWSTEREVSLVSGKAVISSLLKMGLKIQSFKINSKEDLKQSFKEFDLVFNALHGKGGEDGYIQSILEKDKIVFTGSKSSSCKISFNKIETKKIWREIGLPTPDFVEILNIKTPEMELNHFVTGDEDITSLDSSFVVKPAREGSSFGISIVKPGIGNLEDSMKIASKFDKDVLIEAFVEGEEITVSILGSRPLTPITIKPFNQFYDYEAKYLSNKTSYLPSKLSEKKISELEELAFDAYNALGCQGWGRVDFIQDIDGNFQLLEVNTVPGLTKTSLVPKAAELNGLDFDSLIVEILRLAIKDCY